MPPPDDLQEFEDHFVDVSILGEFTNRTIRYYTPKAVYTLEAPPRPQSMDTLEFLDWLDTASVEELEHFASTSYR